MAKLYWRIKKNGKWTWRPCSKQFLDHIEPILDMYGILWTFENPEEAVE